MRPLGRGCFRRFRKGWTGANSIPPTIRNPPLWNSQTSIYYYVIYSLQFSVGIGNRLKEHDLQDQGKNFQKNSENFPKKLPFYTLLVRYGSEKFQKFPLCPTWKPFTPRPCGFPDGDNRPHIPPYEDHWNGGAVLFVPHNGRQTFVSSCFPASHSYPASFIF